MAKKYLDDSGLSHLWSIIKSTFALVGHTHTKSQITDFPTSMTPTSHTHGAITNAGAISTNEDIATGDKLTIVDSSDSNKVKGTNLSFDTETSGTDKKALTQAGTWQTFLTASDVPEGASASSTTPKMDGTATVGTETAFARGDHIHPSDTSKIGKSETLVTAYANDGDSDKSPNLYVKQGDTFGFVEGAGISLTPSSTLGGDDNVYDHKIQIATNAQVNVLEGVQVNGTDLTIDSNKKVNVPLASERYAGAMSATDKTKLNQTQSIIAYTSTASTTAVKTVAAGNISDYYIGMMITVIFLQGNSSSSPSLKLNVNSTADLSVVFGYAETSSKYYACKAYEARTFVLMPTTSTITFGEEVTPSALSHCWRLLQPDTDTTYSNATTSADGLMSSTDKTKLDSITMTNGVIDASVLPSFVDDVIEAYAVSGATELSSTWLATESATGTVITPEAGKIYVLMNSSTNYDVNTQFRWGGSAYVKLNDGGVTAILNTEIDTICV